MPSSLTHPVTSGAADLASALKKAERRIVPLLFIGYMLAILDRGAISLAALQMNASLGLTATQFAWAASAFFVGYLLFEIPSNLMLQRFGAPVWIARIMLTWGLATAATAFVVGPKSFALMRFLLGASEAGFLPGVIYYLGQWFPPQVRARVTANFTLSIPLVSAAGALISGALLKIHGLGLEGWQWIFLVEGAPSILLAVVIWRWLPRAPQTAAFLTVAEKAQLATALNATTTTHAEEGRWSSVFRQPAVWVLGLTNLGFIMCAYAIGLWLPQIARGYGFSVTTVAWIVALPSLAGAAAMWAWGRYGRGGRASELAVILAAAAATMLAAAATIGHAALAITLFTLACVALNAAIPAFWTLSSRLASGRNAAASIALINTIGSISGVIGPPIIGVLKDRSGGYAAGFTVVSLFAVVSVGLALSLRRQDVAAEAVR